MGRLIHEYIWYLSNGINILAGDDPVPIKFGPKDTDSNDMRFTFHTQHAVQSAIAHVICTDITHHSWYRLWSHAMLHLIL